MRMKIISRICVFIGFFILWMVADGFVLPLIGMVMVSCGGFFAGYSSNHDFYEKGE